MNTDIGLKVSKVIEVTPQKVFEAWLDESLVQKFMIPAGGIEITQVEIDAKVGGYLAIMMNSAGFEMPHSGMYREIEKYSKLSFTWVSAFTQTNSLITLAFEECLSPLDSNSYTRLTIDHTGFLNDQNRTDHHFGWITILENLAQCLEEK